MQSTTNTRADCSSENSIFFPSLQEWEKVRGKGLLGKEGSVRRAVYPGGAESLQSLVLGTPCCLHLKGSLIAQKHISSTWHAHPPKGPGEPSATNSKSQVAPQSTSLALGRTGSSLGDCLSKRKMADLMQLQEPTGARRESTDVDKLFWQ